MVYSRSLSELPGILQTFGKACLQHSSTCNASGFAKYIASEFLREGLSERV